MEIVNIIVVNDEYTVQDNYAFTNVKEAEEKFLSLIRRERQLKPTADEEAAYLDDGYFTLGGGSICISHATVRL